MNHPQDFEDLSYRYIVGIYLGTTNSALAYVDLSRKDPRERGIRFFEIPQLTGPGELGKLPVLPSFMYLPGPYELPPESTALPWDRERDYAVGEFAREQGSLVPGRMVSSAKSWLCHGGVDRTGNILPWGADDSVAKVSPVTTASRFLLHLREAWNHNMAQGREGHLLEEQLIVIAVPASFDEVARELTVQAAHQAGLPQLVLLEEPLAAFYAWLSRHESHWQDIMDPGQIILICDVGGGTTDFSIVAIREGEQGLRFDRLAVGDHLMLGGDNMDLSLARHIEMELLGKPGQLDSRRWHQLWHQCRQAKEKLLHSLENPPSARSDENASKWPSTVDITLVGSGSKLISGTLKTSLEKTLVEEIIVEGFFPMVSREASPVAQRRRGISEWGLPFVQDPSVTRHLAAFWNQHRVLMSRETGRSQLYPDFLLFNGGALAPQSIRKRIGEVVASWFQEEGGAGWAPQELENSRPELAVAIGAAYYGLVRMGAGVRVGAGSARSYYVEVSGVQDDQVAQAQGDHMAVCLVPRGTEEGTELRLHEPSFKVLANQPVSFRLFSSSTRLGDQQGDLVTLPQEEITVLPPIKTVLRYGKKSAAQELPIGLTVRLTEVGTLELWCRSQQSPHRWQLQFDVRQEQEELQDTHLQGETLDSDLIEKAQGAIRRVFSKDFQDQGLSPERLVKELTAVLDLSKDRWSTPLLRRLADTLLPLQSGRAFSPQHEGRWFNLLGYCMRPGFGDPLDSWRVKEAWKLFPGGLQFSRQAQCRNEWWVFWRRIAGGLKAGQQWYIYQQVLPVFQSSHKKKSSRKGVKSLSPQENLEIWMALANFERLPAATKVELGRWMLEHARKGGLKNQQLWALSRFGARVPFYGPLDQVIPAEEAAAWVDALVHWKLEPTDSLAQTVVQLSRCTGDRHRDLKEEVREKVRQWLVQMPLNQRYLEILDNPHTTLGEKEQDWIFGESLPAGLLLST